jgi:hypothetical protein
VPGDGNLTPAVVTTGAPDLRGKRAKLWAMLNVYSIAEMLSILI